MKVQIKDGVGFESGDDFVLRAALSQGLGFPYECASGSCGNCRFELLSGDLEYPNGHPTILTDRDAKRNRHLACQCIAKSDIEIKVRLFDEYEPIHKPSSFPATLAEMVTVTHDIVEFRFSASSQQAFEPGQFALLDLPNVAGARAYSMSNLCNSEGQWDFQIKRVPEGSATTRLFDHVAIGDSIDIIGPYGRGYFRGFRGRDIVLVAGGSGLSPMVSIAKAIDQLKDGRNQERVHFFYGGRSEIDLAGESFLTEMSGFGDWLRYEAALSNPTSDQADGIFHGFIHELVKDRIGSDLANVDLYFAGPPLMANAMETVIREYKAPSEHVFYDRFG